jgi:hypothetical protein
LGTAKTLWQVGEYTGGAVPGQPGLAILVGHSGAPSQWGVFENLSDVKVGQTVKVITASGGITSFVVTSSAAYPANTTGAGALFGPATGSVLRLVSCLRAMERQDAGIRPALDRQHGEGLGPNRFGRGTSLSYGHIVPGRQTV